VPSFQRAQHLNAIGPFQIAFGDGNRPGTVSQNIGEVQSTGHFVNANGNIAVLQDRTRQRAIGTVAVKEQNSRCVRQWRDFRWGSHE
jgi:hypothetical protein